MILKFADYLKGREKAIMPGSLESLGRLGIDLFPPTKDDIQRLMDRAIGRTMRPVRSKKR